MSIPVATIVQEVRWLTQYFNQNNLSNDTIMYYMNILWRNTLPQTFADILMQQTGYFMTTLGQPFYQLPLDDAMVSITSVLVDNIPIPFTQQPLSFASAYNNTRINVDFLVGNGTVGPYSGVFPSKPLVPGFTSAIGVLTPGFVITAYDSNRAVLTVTDDGNGNLIGDGSGTISYLTGAVTNLVFNSPILSKEPIRGNGCYFNLGMPYSCLLNQDIFVLRPIPNKAYYMSYVYNAIPSALTYDGTLPIARYQEVLSKGTAMKIAEALKDKELYGALRGLYDQAFNNLTYVDKRQRVVLRPSTLVNNSVPNNANLLWLNNPAPQIP